ncbi:MAG: N-methyl-L-tryptophan oxidase [Acidobacteriota bacterium]
MTHYDVLVAGVGGVGSSALHHLARRGARVLGLDRFAPGHDRGSSHGETRIIRLTYFEHPDYVPLLRRAYELWDELESATGKNLFHRTGILQVGPREGEIVRGVLESASEHGLEVEDIPLEEAARRYPAFRFSEDSAALFEPTGGYLEVEECVRAHAQEAQRAGAEIEIGEHVLDWQPEGDGVLVRTNRREISTGHLVLTVGAWAPSLVQALGIELRVQRQPLFWFDAAPATHSEDSGFPCFFFQTENGEFYGFPHLEPHGLKVAQHGEGHPVDDPLTLDQTVDSDEERRVTGFLERHIPGVRRDYRHHAVCMYTMSSDAHFVVGKEPTGAPISFATGLSGHGFKFTSVLGETLADLALFGRTDAPIEFLEATRPALQTA